MINTMLHARFVLFIPLLLAACTPVAQQQQARLNQVRAEWRQKQHARDIEQHSATFKAWKAALCNVTAAELVHRSPTEENLTPTITRKFSPDEVKELVAILSEALPGRTPQPRPDTEPFVLNKQGEIVDCPERLFTNYSFIDERMDFLHLYDADGNEIVPELSPYEDDISPLSKVHVLDLCRKDTPPWEEPFILLRDDDWRRFCQLPTMLSFLEAVKNIP